MQYWAITLQYAILGHNTPIFKEANVIKTCKIEMVFWARNGGNQISNKV